MDILILVLLQRSERVKALGRVHHEFNCVFFNQDCREGQVKLKKLVNRLDHVEEEPLVERNLVEVIAEWVDQILLEFLQ